ERLRQIGGKLLQGDGGAAHVAARCERSPVETENLHRRRALWHFQRLDGRQVRGRPDEEADGGDARPQGKDNSPVDERAQQRAALSAAASGAAARRPRFGLALAPTRTRLDGIVVRGAPLLACDGGAGGLTGFIGSRAGWPVARGQPQPETGDREG